MKKEKRRPSLEELKKHPELCRIELAQMLVCFPFGSADNTEAYGDELSAGLNDLGAAFGSADLTAEKVIELRERFKNIWPEGSAMEVK